MSEVEFTGKCDFGLVYSVLELGDGGWLLVSIIGELEWKVRMAEIGFIRGVRRRDFPKELEEMESNGHGRNQIALWESMAILDSASFS